MTAAVSSPVPSVVQDPNICSLPLSPSDRAARLAAEYHRHRAYIASREHHYLRQQHVNNIADLWYSTLPHNRSLTYCAHVNAAASYTYQQSEDISNQLAHHFAQCTSLLSLSSIDPQHNRRTVALLMENCPFFLLTWLALAKLGCTIALINTSVTGGQLLAALRVSGARVVIVSKRMRKVWNSAECDLTDNERQQLTVHYSLGWEKESRRDDAAHDTQPPSTTCTASCSAFSVTSPSTSSVRSIRPSPHTPSDSDSEEDESTYYDDDLCPYPTSPYADAASLRSHLHLDDPVFYIFTSGTTGASKAAYFSHRRFMGAGITWTYPMSLTSSDVYYVVLPLFHGNGGVVAVSACWNVGAQMVIREKLSVREFWVDVRRYGVTASIYVGEVWRYIHSAPRRADDADNTLRVIAGNGLRADIWSDVVKRFGIETVVEHFGCTEMPAGPYIAWMGQVGACGYIPPDVRKQQGADKLIAFDVQQGCATRVEAEDERKAAGLPGACVEVAVDEAGECIFKLAPPLPSPSSSSSSTTESVDNPHVPLDTLQRSTDTNPLYKPYHGYTDYAANSKRVYRHVFGAYDAWFSTGDLLRCDAEGFFYFVDRTGDTFRWKGENVSTNEVAEAMAAFGGIAQVNVYGVQYDGRDGKAGMASVRLSDDSVDFAELFSHLYASLPHYAIPIFIRITSSIAETSTSKYQKYRAVQEGFDPSRVGGDALYTLDGKGCTYRPLTEQRYAEVVSSGYRAYELIKRV